MPSDNPIQSTQKLFDVSSYLIFLHEKAEAQSSTCPSLGCREEEEGDSDLEIARGNREHGSHLHCLMASMGSSVCGLYSGQGFSA